MWTLIPAVVLLTLASLAGPAFAEEWSRGRIEKLPDSASAVVEIAEDEKRR